MTNDQFRAVVEAAAKVCETTPIREWEDHGPVMNAAERIRSIRPSDCGVRVDDSAMAKSRLVELLNNEGLEAGHGTSLHSWRCNYPDRYGKCDCVSQLADQIIELLAAAPPPPAAPTDDHDASDCGPSVPGERKGEE